MIADPETIEANEFLRADMGVGAPGKVDRENKVIRGYVVAQLGIFKDRRGEFNADSLKAIRAMANKGELKTRFAHPTESNDGLGTFLGRPKRFRVDGNKLRADLHFADSAFKTPRGDLAGYVMDLAEEDPDALSSSLAGKWEKTDQLNEQGTELLDEEGQPRPSLWMPKLLHASDIVDTGDATDGLLSVDDDSMPASFASHAAAMADKLFRSQPQEVVAAKLTAWLDRYLTYRYGGETMPKTPEEKKTETGHDPAVVPAEALAAIDTKASELAAKEQRLDELLGKAESQLAALDTAAAEAAVNKRAVEIAGACALIGRADLAAEWIAEETLTVDMANRRALEMLAESRPPLEADDSLNPDGTGKTDPDEKYKAEYLAAKDVHEANGITEEAYVESRRRDDAGGVLHRKPQTVS